MNWEPTQADIQWQTNMVAMLTDGARWGVPGTESEFQIDKTNKVVRLTFGNPNESDNQRIIKVFEKMGYTFEKPSGPVEPGQRRINPKHPWEK